MQQLDCGGGGGGGDEESIKQSTKFIDRSQLYSSTTALAQNGFSFLHSRSRAPSCCKLLGSGSARCVCGDRMCPTNGVAAATRRVGHRAPCVRCVQAAAVLQCWGAGSALRLCVCVCVQPASQSMGNKSSQSVQCTHTHYTARRQRPMAWHLHSMHQRQREFSPTALLARRPPDCEGMRSIALATYSPGTSAHANANCAAWNWCTHTSNWSQLDHAEAAAAAAAAAAAGNPATKLRVHTD